MQFSSEMCCRWSNFGSLCPQPNRQNEAKRFDHPPRKTTTNLTRAATTATKPQKR
ncbi:hypothetical protein PGT21_030528 [Puccinia graminis f. sp. tritici]|uniref:Uncharacterized protein n=1 Tax=Puccinia graminis f. sp. tritici TaxID=56615 RepID=A0A5B0M8C8_PUCGR|nr:hypothetical protein PGT21_030528 [Puccinia graminis f. sp. tritici]KAA1078537.1 hypothetical protein PGTUg99_009259 [Puccinia graminis f. sp. tritici]